MSNTLALGDLSRDGLLQIMDTSWDSNGTLTVTVRERIGGFNAWGIPERLVIERMRRLARRCIMYPEKTRSSRLIRKFHADGCGYATFAVSRLEP